MTGFSDVENYLRRNNEGIAEETSALLASSVQGVAGYLGEFERRLLWWERVDKDVLELKTRDKIHSRIFQDLWHE
ncbi:hypothetical protein PHLCEN_2v8662 [Hermanssonia centrifuga]|uniref:Uncharacterized protein n=1 Tax=Hermanssonia centrifuga TaxID=98765 RepID=A0A2R6NSY6_9APHY|nr:hypothetical protein PHLCEN_2v8662 [Hermanssonia centrifuga]